MNAFIRGVLVGLVLWVLFLRFYGDRFRYAPHQASIAGERGKIKAQLKQGLTLDQIANNCKYHDRDDVLHIKNEMWEKGWENS